MFGVKMPQSIFVHADGFFKASQVKTDPPNPYDFAVSVVNCAMACELYLKCLIQIENGMHVREHHDLRKLFNMLPIETKTVIQQRFDAIMATQFPEYDYSAVPENERKKYENLAASMPKTLVEALRKGGNAFVEWRYAYELEDGDGKPFTLAPFPHVLRAIILEKKPEWRNFGFRMQKVGTVRPTSPVR